MSQNVRAFAAPVALSSRQVIGEGAVNETSGFVCPPSHRLPEPRLPHSLPVLSLQNLPNLGEKEVGLRPTLLLACYLALGKLLHFSEPQYPHVENGDKTNPYL